MAVDADTAKTQAFERVRYNTLKEWRMRFPKFLRPLIVRVFNLVNSS
jgi:hypothetical protein